MLAVICATINVVGGFMVTDRMLEMFKPAKCGATGLLYNGKRAPLRAISQKLQGKQAIFEHKIDRECDLCLS